MQLEPQLTPARQGYMPHVDGLRALAVISVILFHLEFALFSGGFIGVDVFFVISGYLITAHIRQAVNDGRFSFSWFYAKRARRLLPALFVTLLLTLVGGWWVLPAANYERLSIESLFALFSVSNFLFWNESGYFDGASTLKPLLHTWSLSVEEQFYLFWPLLLCFIKKERAAFSLLAVMGVVSLLAAEMLVRTEPALVFYMMPFRIVEFSVGGMLVWLEKRLRAGALVREACSALGLLAIIVPVFLYQETTVFPGVTALLPCLGAALIIAFGASSRIASCLSWRPVVYIGLISYSLYLVHWPLIVLYKYGVHRFLLLDKLLLLLVMIVLAVAMFHWVETPFRRRSAHAFWSTPRFVPAMLLSFVALVGFCAVTKEGSGWPQRFDYAQLTAAQIEQGKKDRFELIKLNCRNRGWDNCEEPSADVSQNVLILGDSHAADGLNILQSAYPDKYFVIRSLGGCPPALSGTLNRIWEGWSELEKCQALNDERLAPEFLQKFDTLVIALYWGRYTPEHLPETLDYLEQHTKARILVLGNYLALEEPMPDLFNQQIDPRLSPDVVKSFALFEESLAQLSQDRYRFISKRDLLCKGDTLMTCQIDFDGVPFSYDEHHLSLSAAQYAAEQLASKAPEWNALF